MFFRLGIASSRLVHFRVEQGRRGETQPNLSSPRASRMRPKVRVLKDLIPSWALSQSAPSSPGDCPPARTLSCIRYFICFVNIPLTVLCPQKPPLLDHPSWPCQCDNALSPPSLAPLIRIDIDKYLTMI